MAGTCEYVDELSGSIKFGEFLQNRLASEEGLCSMEQVSRYNILLNVRLCKIQEPEDDLI